MAAGEPKYFSRQADKSFLDSESVIPEYVAWVSKKKLFASVGMQYGP
jgi:hypothetical protein